MSERNSTPLPTSGSLSPDDEGFHDLTEDLDLGFDGAEDILRAWAKGMRPDPDLTVSEWADQHRWLSSRASAEPGRYRTARTPYLREIMDALLPGNPFTRLAENGNGIRRNPKIVVSYIETAPLYDQLRADGKGMYGEKKSFGWANGIHWLLREQQIQTCFRGEFGVQPSCPVSALQSEDRTMALYLEFISPTKETRSGTRRSSAVC